MNGVLPQASARLIRLVYNAVAVCVFVISMFSHIVLAQVPDDIVYCPDNLNVPPPPGVCPVLGNFKAECVAPLTGAWGWWAQSWDYGAFPECQSQDGYATPICSSEQMAWDVWRSKMSDVCLEPSRTYQCSKVIQIIMGVVDVRVNKYYDPPPVVGIAGPDGSCNMRIQYYASSMQQRTVSCPSGFSPNVDNTLCYRIKPEACPAGNPIQCAGGQKTQAEADFVRVGASPLEFVRYYSSTGFYASPGTERPREVLGARWRHNWQSKVVVEQAASVGQETYAYVMQPDGDYRHFHLSGGDWFGRADKSEALQEVVVGGARVSWTYIAADESIYRFDANGRWLSLEQAGRVTTLSYSDSATPPSIAPKPGLLIRVTDSQGRYLDLRYDAASYLTQVTDSAGGTLSYRYAMQQIANLPPANTGLLRFVDHPGRTTREYLYDEVSHVAAGIPYTELLTGIVDEMGQRYATYEYDSGGRAWKEWHGTNADLLTLTYHNGTYNNATSRTEMVSALGQATRRKFVAVAGVVRDAGTDRCTDLNCSPVTATSSKTYDNNGNPNLFTDFNGVVTDYDFGLPGKETQRVEAANDSSPAATSAKRTIQTAWQPIFRVPTERRTYNATSVPGVDPPEAVSRWAYNTRGQTTARCEINPTDSLAMSYACSATTAPNVAAKVRRSVTTYCEQADVTAGICPLVGLVTSSNGARATNDSGMGSQDDLTTYTYRMQDDPTCATGGACTYRKGDLWKVTNALGQIAETVKYDKSGRPTQLKDANGTLTDLTYHPRGWLVDRIVRQSAGGIPSSNDAITHIDYYPTGDVMKVTQPDGAFLAYTYDAAHRLIKIADKLGNMIDYCPGGIGSADCLDAAGNRRIEQIKDPGGVVKRSLRRTYNQLSQLMETLNAQNDPTFSYPEADGYDPNGNPTHSEDGLGVKTHQEYDPLNRLKTTIQDYLGTDPDTTGTTTGYIYDVRDNLRTVTDPDGLATNYDYDGLNNLTGLHSPDTGDTNYTYDLAGNRITQTDARGIQSTYTYDALNRLTAISYPTSSLDVGFAYDLADSATGCVGSYSLGRLSRITDASGTTTYCYDRRGNVTRKIQVTASDTLSLVYTWTLADRLATITYPSGGIATYSRNGIGQINQLTWKANAGATPVTVISGVTYYPFGPPNVLTYGNGRTLTKDYDDNYAINSVASSDPNGLVLDFTTDVMGNIVDARDTLGAPNPTRTYAYDRLYRLKEVENTAGQLQEGFAYTKTGDRTQKTLPGQSAEIYSYLAGTHRLGDVAGVARDYDDNGNLVRILSGRASPTFTYDDRNRMSASLFNGQTLASYQINGRGERVAKTRSTPGTSRVFVYDEAGHSLGDYPPAAKTKGNEFLYLDDLPVAILAGGALSYLETDHLGTPRIAANPATNAWQWQWSFFGEAFGDSAPTQAVSGGIDVNLRYPGQRFDGETGLNYNYFRDYEAGTGRYIESDPIGLDGGISTYAYVNDSPLSKSDSLGLETCGSGWNDRFVPDNPFRFKFSGCCQEHDDCYGCGGATAGVSKSFCDTNFRDCMKEKCSKYGAPIRFVCRRLAGTYYRAVKRFGSKPFDSGRRNCGCDSGG